MPLRLNLLPLSPSMKKSSLWLANRHHPNSFHSATTGFPRTTLTMKRCQILL